MFFSSSGEFVFVTLFLVSYLVVSCLPVKWPRKWGLFLGNLALLSTVVNEYTIGVQLVLSLLVFAVGTHLLKSQRNTRSRKILGVSISVLIGLFIYRNYSTDITLIGRLGISYILFRHIQFLVDASKKRFTQLNVLDYFNFILFFPNFLAGPIDTYGNFSCWHNRDWGSLKKALLLPGLLRIFIGAVKKLALVPIVINEATNYELLTGEYGVWVGLLLSAMAYSAYIYLDFSGYSDIAIGTGYLLGIRTPENFQSPYLSTNLADFWRRWHMTFSVFLRNMIFKPLVTQLSGRFPQAPRLLISSIGYIITFVLCGIWHGNTLNFIYWGLWHGVGLVMLKLWDSYQPLVVKNQWSKSWLYQSGTLLLTFLFVSTGWLLFHYSHDQLIEILSLL